jgi:hypothetical protein
MTGSFAGADNIHRQAAAPGHEIGQYLERPAKWLKIDLFESFAFAVRR